ncbi:DUF4097 domain-containing protein [bacterium]|nr:DUF4097 domain-containing protein [bacterium]
MRMKRWPAAAAVLWLAVASTAAGGTVDTKVDCAADGTGSISNVAGKVEVEGWDRKEVHVTGTLGEKVRELHVDAEDGDVDIEVELPRRMRGGGGDADLTVRVPKGVTLEIETVSASIRVKNVEGELELESVSGSIDVRADAKLAELATVSGGIDVNGKIPTVEAESVSGAITLRETSGRAEVATTSSRIAIDGGDFVSVSCTSVSGGIEFDGNPVGNGDFEFENFSGSIELTLPGNVNADFEMESFSGGIHSELGGHVDREEHGPGKSLAVTYGNGSAEFSVTTFSGSIRVRKK